MTKPQPINSDAPRFSFFRRLLDLFAPRLCCICGQRLTPTEKEICISCNLGLPRTGYAASPLDNLLSRRFWGRIPVERCASLYFYKVHSHTKRPVLRLKYMDHPETAIFFGKMMGREFGEEGFFEGMDMMIPIPLAKNRMRERGYNQSEMIARGIAEVTGLRVETEVAVRSTFKGSQTRLGRMERFDNVEGLFSVKHPERIAGCHLLIIDDVITTGATTSTLARELLKAGAKTISIASVACTRHF